MKMMVTQNMVTSIPKTIPPNIFFKGCMLGKHHQEPFGLGKAWHAHDKMEHIHSGLCCMNKPSLAGVKYILTFNDDLSQFTWVYLLKNKIQRI